MLDIVHGDIKPQNVLIFDNEEGGYVARVADVGYSTQWALPDDLVRMPRSRPWDAPEWHHRGFTPTQAMEMDAYFFWYGGLVATLLRCAEGRRCKLPGGFAYSNRSSRSCMSTFWIHVPDHQIGSKSVLQCHSHP